MGHHLGRRGRRFFKPSGGGPPGPPRSIRLRPYAPSWEQRVIVTLERAGVENRPLPSCCAAVRSGPAFADDDRIGASGRTLAASVPVREYGFLPHVRRDPLLLNGTAVTASGRAFVGIGWSTVEGVSTGGTTRTTRLRTEPWKANIFKRTPLRSNPAHGEVWSGT